MIRRAAVCLLLLLALSAGGDSDEIVSFNVNSLKYHCVTCAHARRCTRSCIEVRRSVARARGGVACKHCGGSCGQ